MQVDQLQPLRLLRAVSLHLSTVGLMPLPDRFSSIITGRGRSFALDADGSLWVTGLNAHGQLGLGDRRNRDRWTRGQFDHSVAQIAIGDRHTVILDSDGGLWGCGVTDFDFGRSGTRGGLPLTPPSPCWEAITLPRRIVSVAATWLGTLAVDDTGRLWVRGTTAFGELGLGQRGSVEEWSSKLTGISRVWAEDTCSFALATNGVLLVAGLNAPSNDLGLPYSGQLGVGHLGDCWDWEATTLHAQAADLAIGYNHTLVLDSDGRVWGAGDNGSCQLGLEGLEGTRDFVECGPPEPVRAIAAGTKSSYAIGQSNWLWTCGASDEGNTGRSRDRLNRWRRSALPVPVTSISAWANHALALAVDGRLWILGSCLDAALGVDTASEDPGWFVTPTGSRFDVFATLCADGVPMSVAAALSQALE